MFLLPIKKIHERFDLKGSTFGRVVTDEERETFKENVTYKDIDWRAAGKKLRLGPLKDVFCEQLTKDCLLLERLNIMDYSLLVGIHNCNKNDGDCSIACTQVEVSKEKKNQKKKKIIKRRKKPRNRKKKSSMSEEDEDNSSCEIPRNNKNEDSAVDNRTKSISKHQTNFPLPPKFSKQVISAFQVEDGGMRGISEDIIDSKEYYYVGIIDILMLYTLRKRAEHTYKTIRFNSEKSEISSVNPTDYAQRFLDFISNTTV